MRLVLLALLVLAIGGCRHDRLGFQAPSSQDSVEFNPTPTTLSYPNWFPEMPLNEYNPLTVEGIELGRKLYYDSKLHPSGNQSCASCHHQDKSFTINSEGTAVLAHINLGWSTAFLWKGGVEGNVESAARFEVVEFFNTDVNVLQDDPDYPALFGAAFGSTKITTELCAKALAQYLRSMISLNSRFDNYYPGKIAPSNMEEMGYEIFNSEKGDCFHCHTPPLFTDNRFHNTGLDSSLNQGNLGRSEVTGLISDHGKFKTPTLRNIALTAPYMHDGRYTTLEQVIDFYDHGVKQSETLDPIMTKLDKSNGLKLSAEEKAALIAFLHSLTDSSYTQDIRFSKP